MRPFETFPGTNGPSNFTLNHSPNSRWSVSARQTRDTGAFNSIVFSIRLDICNYLVAFQYVWIWSICNRFVALVSERSRSTEELDYERNGETALMAHARSGSKPARMSHRAIPSSARRVLRPTGQGPSSLHRPFAVSPTRRLASSAPLTISKKNRMNAEEMATPRLILVVNLWSLRDYPSAARPWSLEEQLDAVKAAGFDGFTT